MNIAPFLYSLLLLAISALFAKRALDAVRYGAIGWGSNKPIYIERRKNPFAFWFFVALFIAGAVGILYVAVVQVQQLVAA
jgi:hypothetical protein